MSSLLFDTGDVRCGSCTPPPSSQQSHSCYLGSHVGTHMGTHMGTQVRVPPFVPRPHRAASAGETLLPPVVGGTLASQPRALSTASANFSAPPPVSTVTCNAHEVCHYFQQVFYVSAILTGIALVIAGAIQTGVPEDPVDAAAVGGGDLLVFVYIGVLLIGVNVSLLLLQCYMRSKELRRARRSTPATAVLYNPLVSGAPPRQVSS